MNKDEDEAKETTFECASLKNKAIGVGIALIIIGILVIVGGY